MTIAVLATLVSLGLVVALVASLRETSRRETEARQSEALAIVADASIDLFAALKLERGRGQLYVTTGDLTDAERYQSTFALTDRLIDAQAAAFASARALSPESQDLLPGADGDVLTAVNSVTNIRNEILAGNVQANEQVYAGAINPLLQRFSDQSILTRSVEQIRLRRAVTALLTAADALGRRRAQVTGLIASGVAPGPDEAIQLSILQRDFSSNVSQAAILAAGIDGPGGQDIGLTISRMLRSPATAAVDNQLADILARENADPMLVDRARTPQEWFETASAQFREVITNADQINDDVHRRATASVAAARSDQRAAAILFTSLLGLSMIVGAGAILASRDRVRALAEHRDVVEGLREWFLPATFPEVDGVQLEGRYLPASAHADAGGDWYDAFHDNRGRLHLVIGDVAGHTPRMVAHVAELRNVIRGVAHASEGGPARILEIVDASSNVGPMTTVFFARVSLQEGTLTYSRAGHVPAVLRKASGAVELLSGGTDLPLGVDNTVTRTEFTRDFCPGDTLVLLTDGLVDGPDTFLPDELDRLAVLVGEASDDDLGQLGDRLQRLRAGAVTDDVSLLIMHRMVVGAPNVHASDLPVH